MRHLSIYRNIDAVAKAGSIRQAAELLAITPSALNRQILSLEEELGAPIFERLPRGVRLSSSGELMLHHIRKQLSDFEKVQSRIADLSGMRRGHVNIACSQALLPCFLPQQIEIYRKTHPFVTFNIAMRDRDTVEQSLREYTVDIAMIFEPLPTTDCQTLQVAEQRVHAILARDHPLAQRKSVKLEDCIAYPLAMPSHPKAGRLVIDKAAAKKGLELNPVIQSDSFEFLRHAVLNNQTIAFQFEIGLPPQDRNAPTVSVPLAEHDVPAGLLHLMQLSGRSLPVASARFANQLQSSLADISVAIR